MKNTELYTIHMINTMLYCMVQMSFIWLILCYIVWFRCHSYFI